MTLPIFKKPSDLISEHIKNLVYTSQNLSNLRIIAKNPDKSDEALWNQLGFNLQMRSALKRNELVKIQAEARSRVEHFEVIAQKTAEKSFHIILQKINELVYSPQNRELLLALAKCNAKTGLKLWDRLFSSLASAGFTNHTFVALDNHINFLTSIHARAAEQALLFSIQHSPYADKRLIPFLKLIKSAKILQDFYEISDQISVALGINADDLKVLFGLLDGKSLEKVKNEAEKQIFNIKKRDISFKTWESKPENVKDIRLYFQQLFSHIMPSGEPARKILMEMSSSESIESTIMELETFCKTKRPVYYIQSAEDLICSGNYIEYDENFQGKSKSGPGGALYNFIQKHKNDSPLFIINYNNFSLDQFAPFNALLDSFNADGIALPKNSFIIGFVDSNNKDIKKKSDFHSRFNVKRNPLYQSLTYKNLNKQEIPPLTDSNDQEYVIDLYESKEWKDILLGKPVFQNGGIHFNKGELIKAIQKYKAHKIVLKNPPNDSKFRFFIHQALLNKEANVDNLIFQLPSDLIFMQANGYEDYKKLVTNIEMLPEEGDCYILNPSKLFYFFTDYELDKEGFYTTLPGIIKRHEGKPLNIYLTRKLDKPQEAKIFDLCAKHNVTLHIREKFDPWHHSKNCSVYTCDDIDYAVYSIKKTTKIDKVIDVSEYSASDLLSHVEIIKEEKKKTSSNDQLKPLRFKEMKCALVNALEKGETVALTGDFSDELIDNLAPLMLDPLKGKLILISKDQHTFSFFNATQNIPVSVDNKREALKGLYSRREDDVLVDRVIKERGDESFVRMRTMIEFAQKHPDQNDWMLLPWQALYEVPIPQLILNEVFHFDQAEKISDEFNTFRIQKILHAFEDSFFTFVSGISGAGKSTFNGYALLFIN